MAIRKYVSFFWRILKIYSCSLSYGDCLSLYSGRTNRTILQLVVALAVDPRPEFDIKIPLTGGSPVKIGATQQSDIVVSPVFVKDGQLVIRKSGSKYQLLDQNLPYGYEMDSVPVRGNHSADDFTFLALGEAQFCICSQYLYIAGVDSNNIRVQQSSAADVLKNLDYPRFYRSMRMSSPLNTEKIEILEPPAKPAEPENNLMISILPILLMVFVMIVFRSSSETGGGSFILFSVASMSIGIVSSLMVFFQSKKKYRKLLKHREEAYSTYLVKKEQEIQEKRKAEALYLRQTYPSSDEEFRKIQMFSPTLFHRRLYDQDFLDLRIGTGSIKSRQLIDFKEKEEIEIDDELKEKPKELSEKYRYLHDVPVVINLKELDSAGIIGERTVRNTYLLQYLLLDLITSQHPDDMCLWVLTDEMLLRGNKWLRWIPHLRENGERHLGFDAVSVSRVLDDLYTAISAASDKGDEKKWNVILVFNKELIKAHPVYKLIHECRKKGFVFLFAGETPGEIPRESELLLKLPSLGNGESLSSQFDDCNLPFQWIPTPAASMSEAADILAPVYSDTLNLDKTLVSDYTFFDMYKIYDPQEISLISSWKSHDITKSMAAPLGINARSEIVSLDLHENAHGPHGLVAGTTGSGKSEILQSYILSAAICYPPSDIGFMIIDFKGGGMANQFRQLPHILGTITNIDGNQIERSLLSIRAELEKRQRLFAAAGVNKIEKYIRQYHSGEVRDPIPHLVIIVDEFAELKMDYPDFMKELISTARIGRSLGVHLILATQKPSGQVDDQIWSNSRFRLCLKVQSQADSKEMLHSPLAAEIREPGRAYLQVGDNEIFELFQSAYSGGDSVLAKSVIQKEFDITRIHLNGIREVIYHQGNKKVRSDSVSSKSQLEAVVEYIQETAEQNHIAIPHSIILPPLPERIPIPESAESSGYGSSIEIGIVDCPERQIQEPFKVDFTSGHTMVIGSSQTGKTNLLMTAIRQIVSNTTPAMFQIYVMDFANRTLNPFAELHHVGGVVFSNEEEKVNNLFRMLLELMNERRQVIANRGLGSFSSYLEAGYSDMPQLFLVIDNLSALLELYLQDRDDLLMLFRDGISAGISIIASSSQSSGIPYRYWSNISNRIAFYCNDSSQYSSLFDHCRMTVPQIPGRAIVQQNKKLYECQCYQAFDGEKEIDRVAGISEFIRKINAKDENACSTARPVPYVPDVLPYEQFIREYQTDHNLQSVALGIDYASISAFGVNLQENGPLGIVSRNPDMKIRIGSLILTHYLQYKDESAIWIIDNKIEEFADFEPYSHKYAATPADGIQIYRDFADTYKQRKRQYNNGDGSISKQTIVLLLNSQETIRQIDKDFDLSDGFSQIFEEASSLGLHMIVADYPNSNVSYDAPAPFRILKQSPHFLYSGELNEAKFYDPDYEVQRVYRKKGGKEDAFYIKDRDVLRIHLAQLPKLSIESAN